MWDWYNRPGGRAALPLPVVIVALIVAGVLVGVFFALFYTFLAPALFRPVPTPHPGLVPR